jgi:putative sterol carrier protein
MEKEHEAPRMDSAHRRLRSFLALPEDLDTGFRRMADMLAEASVSGVFRFNIVGEDEAVFDIPVGEMTGMDQLPEVEVSLRRSTWVEIAAGRLSPWEALNKGELLLRGSLDLAKKATSSLAIEID